MDKKAKPHINVCICTHKRPLLLQRALDGIARLEVEDLFTYSIIVTDNDPSGSARQTVLDFRASSLLAVDYYVEPEQNIARARNMAVKNATGDFIAFLDDDEFPASDWLLTLFKCCLESGADGVLGPVRPFFDQPPPKWLVRGKFCDREEHSTGFELHWRQTRTGNVLIKRKIIAGIAEPFRPEFGTGGEDQDFFRRMIQTGYRFVWCNEAVAYEVVPPKRWTRGYMLRRALQRGQNEKHLLNLSGLSRSMLALPCYTVLVPFLFVVRHDFFMKCLIRLCDHAGKLLAAVGFKPVGDRYVSH